MTVPNKEIKMTDENESLVDKKKSYESGNETSNDEWMMNEFYYAIDNSLSASGRQSK